ncbi:E3 ubiquitin-protein ligase rad18 [Vermiconidia calcicola]|uniref:E3 ubiquitin-protein ligase rad18 n=1 Tax=Vermiconidia calcicola TaxID=1690605 RepID=A0ACC3NQ06_9PEZI|nr:E3 ubiquitin-protein ligase rad18 [Vermiconidia calcicola]
MDGTYDIPDPSDWLDTPLKGFSDLENALHCDICKEFYDTPMITSCCHTFCSKCIRTCLSTNGKCPSCQTSDQANKLRNNWVLQTIVDQFLTTRPAALEVARKEKVQEEQAKRPGKRKRAVLDSDDIAQAEQDGRTTRSKSRRLAASQTSEPEAVEISDSDGDEEYAPEQQPDDGLIECLLGCGKRMKAEEMGAHIDRCEEEKQQEQASRAKSRTPVNSFSSRQASAPNTKAPERISELSYSMLTEAKLRQKLKDAGIPNWGSKQVMIKRHMEWVNLWNANCDSKGRRGRNELFWDLDAWERTQGGRAPNQNGLSSTIMRKDFDGTGWATSHGQDFSRLIADAKRRKNNPATEDSRPKDVDTVEVAAEPVSGPETDGSSILPPNSSQTSRQPEHNFPETERPYENNPEAIASIRQKVEAANAGRHIEPVMNAGFDNEPVNGETTPTQAENPAEPPRGAQNPSLLGQSHFECELPAHLQSSPMKVPMFAMPQRPISDVDGGGDMAER